MGEPERKLEKLEKEQEIEDAAFLQNLEKESKEFDKVREHLKGCCDIPSLIHESRTARLNVS